MSQFHKLSIKQIHKETAQSVTLSFEVPEAIKGQFDFKAGQYITLRTTLNKEEVRRDYSLCTSPKSGELKVAVKEIENGIFSKYANRELKVGDILDVASPKGHFIFEPQPNKSRTIAAFAAGSGITPILSIAKSVLEDEPLSSFVLVYGNKSRQDTIFFDELTALQSEYGQRLTVQYVYSRAQEEDALFGRIEKSTVNLIINNKFKDQEIEAFYLCGPEAMIHTVKDVLVVHGIPSEQIFYELFKTAKAVEAIEEASHTGTTKITVLVDDEESTFEMQQKYSILEAALDQDLDAPYSCQGGICSSCIARITEGSATMRQNNILTDGEVAEGLVLTCQAHPTSASLRVDYDDV